MSDLQRIEHNEGRSRRALLIGIALLIALIAGGIYGPKIWKTNHVQSATQAAADKQLASAKKQVSSAKRNRVKVRQTEQDFLAQAFPDTITPSRVEAYVRQSASALGVSVQEVTFDSLPSGDPAAAPRIVTVRLKGSATQIPLVADRLEQGVTVDQQTGLVTGEGQAVLLVVARLDVSPQQGQAAAKLTLQAWGVDPS